MNKWLAFFIITFKGTFLACFSLMGIFFAMETAAAVPPCHLQMEMPAETTDQNEICPACEISQDGWEQQLVFFSELKITAPVALRMLVSWEELLTASEPGIVFSAPDPPDDDGVWHAELVVKNSTVFVI